MLGSAFSALLNRRFSYRQFFVAGLLLTCCAGVSAESSPVPSTIVTFGTVGAVNTKPMSATTSDAGSATKPAREPAPAPDTEPHAGPAAGFYTPSDASLDPSAEHPSNTTNWLTLSNQIAGSAEGFDKHRLSDGRKLVGWKLSDTLYFGRAKKEGATVSLVWEKAADQRVSLSTDGIKFTRRFR